MVLTVIEAEITPKRWNDLKKAYENLVKNSNAENSPMQSWLLQDRADVNIWRLMAVWSSLEVFDAMRRKGTPRGVQMFRDFGVDPTLSVFDVIALSNVPEPTPMSPH